MEKILFAIDRTDIESGNTNAIRSFISRITSNLSLSGKLQGKIDISVSGYDADPRELWEIVEVRNWFKSADYQIKYWFYFLSTDEKSAGLKILFACLCGTKTKKKNSSKRREIVFDKECADRLMSQNWLYLNEMTERLGMSEEQNKKISFDVMSAVFGETSIKHLRKKYDA